MVPPNGTGVPLLSTIPGTPPKTDPSTTTIATTTTLVSPVFMLTIWMQGLYAAGVGLFLGAALSHAMDLPMLVDGALFPAHPQAARRAIPEVFIALLLSGLWLSTILSLTPLTPLTTTTTTTPPPPSPRWYTGSFVFFVGPLFIVSAIFVFWLLNSRYDMFTKRQNTKYLFLMVLVGATPLLINMLMTYYVQTGSTSRQAVANSLPWRLLLQIPVVALLGRLFYLGAGYMSLRACQSPDGRRRWLHTTFLCDDHVSDRVQHEHVALLVSLTLVVVHLVFILLYWLLNSMVVVVFSTDSPTTTASMGGSSHPHYQQYARTPQVHLHVMAAVALLMALNAWLVSCQRYTEGERHDGDGGGGDDDNGRGHGWLALIGRLDHFRRNGREWADMRPFLCCDTDSGSSPGWDLEHGGGGGGHHIGDMHWTRPRPIAAAHPSITNSILHPMRLPTAQPPPDPNNRRQ